MMHSRPRITLWLIWATVVSLDLGVVRAQNSSDAKRLGKDLFESGYDQMIRPVLNQSQPLPIFVEFNLFSINYLDEVTETLQTTGSLEMFWTDEALGWDPANYGGLEEYGWPQNIVWKPDIALINSYVAYQELGDDSMRVRVYKNGIVRWNPLQVFVSTCSVDIRHFPYDTQTCELRFAVLSYNVEEVLMKGGRTGINLREYTPSSAWDIIDTDWRQEDKEFDSIIVFRLRMRRKPTYFLLNLFYPILLLSVLNICVFVLPVESGEKASYAVTVFLAFAVYLTIMESLLPENSESVSYFEIFVLVETTKSIIITILALVLLRLNSLNMEVPRCLAVLVRWPIGKICRALWRQKQGRKIGEKVGDQAQAIQDDMNGDIGLHVLPTKAWPDTDGGLDEDTNCTWSHVTSALDKWLFVVSFLTLIIEVNVCLGLAQSG